MFSCLLLTKNEESTIATCLTSLLPCDDIVVYDSYSSDRTLEIASQFGARIVQRTCQDPGLPFGGDEGFHRTWGLRNIHFKHDWLFVIDSDECITPSLFRELLLISDLDVCDFHAYRVLRRDFFLGRHLKHAQASPFYVRFLRPQYVRYDRLINTVTVVDGPVGQLCNSLDHFPFAKGIHHWLDRHNSYSTFEAQQILHNRHSQQRFSIRAAFLERDFNRRRFHQKELFYRLPARPLIKFLLLYVLKRGFLDGRPGFTYALLQSIYEAMIVLKVQELEQSK